MPLLQRLRERNHAGRIRPSCERPDGSPTPQCADEKSSVVESALRLVRRHKRLPVLAGKTMAFDGNIEEQIAISWTMQQCIGDQRIAGWQPVQSLKIAGVVARHRDNIVPLSHRVGSVFSASFCAVKTGN